MKALLVADQQNSFPTYKYARKLARRLEKMGVKASVLFEDIKDAQEVIASKKPDVLHIHYHPDARKLRRVMAAAQALNIPFIVTYHRVLRVPDDRRNHMRKCLEKTNRAYFLTQPDYDAAIAINPELKKHGSMVRMPSPHDVAEDVLRGKEQVIDSFFASKKPRCRVLFCGDIAPDEGLEEALELCSALPKNTELVVAGTIMPGEGAYAKYMKAKAKFEKLPVSWIISKRAMGTSQLTMIAADCLFAYMPCGKPGVEHYGGASLHSMLIPVLNRTRTRVFSHRGEDSTAEMDGMVHWVSKPVDIPGAIAHYHAQHALLRDALSEAECTAAQMDWPVLAKMTADAYVEALQA